jgi:hypothetical protein
MIEQGYYRTDLGSVIEVRKLAVGDYVWQNRNGHLRIYSESEMGDYLGRYRCEHIGEAGFGDFVELCDLTQFGC